MVFSSSIFVFAFLPITLLFYAIAEKSGNMTLKNIVLLVCSIIFYAWGGVQYLILLLALLVFNYFISLFIEKFNNKKRLFLFVGLSGDILVLVFFKYFNFLAENILDLFKFFGVHFDLVVPQIPLPIGISFFSFQIISYLIDVYRGQAPAQKSIGKLALYIMMFPQLIAGPIVRYIDVNNALEKRTSSMEMVEDGIKRFIIGFAKKVFIANAMGSMADTVFGVEGSLNSVYAWCGAIAYALQIYYDFSAYSDMAIGLGLIFGFRFNENFNYPYISKSIQEFWRRWHISLSSWFRDYVYISLGGNRKGAKRTYINLFIVFLLTGIWHGAAWQFILWGLFHGFFLIIERAGFKKVLNTVPSIVCRVYTLGVVLIGWVLFRADSLEKAIIYLKNMFAFNFTNWNNSEILFQFSNIFIILMIIAIVASMPIYTKLNTKLKSIKGIQVISKPLYLMLWIVSVMYMVGLTYNPFIYFKF